MAGLLVCRQADARYMEDFIEGRDPSGKSYYWLTGRFVSEDTGEDSDVSALAEGYVTVVPAWNDMTDYPAIDELRTFLK